MNYARCSLLFAAFVLLLLPAGVRADETDNETEVRVAVPQPSELALERYRSGNIVWVVNQVWGLLIPGLFLVTSLSARLRTWAERIGRRWYFVICLYFLMFVVLNYLIDWPLNYYEEFLRPHAYGLSNQTFGRWLAHSFKSLGVNIVAGCLFLWVPYLLMRKSPRRWWLYTGLLLLPFAFIVAVVMPVVIDPLFNDFHPMADKDLEKKILALAERAGIEGSRVFVVDKSKDTKQVNAYVTGLGGTKRIVLWDTLLHRLDEQEILFIVGHEMGHYVLHHVIQGTLVAVALGFLGLWLLDRGARWVLAASGGRMGFDRLDDIASLPLLLLGVNLLYLILAPLGLVFSRHCEHEADRFGLEITENNQAAARSFVDLQRENLGVPWPGLFYKVWRGSHPSLGERIEFCNDYRPWANGEPLKYDRFFKKPPSP